MFTPKTGTGFPSSASGRALASSSRRRSSIGGLGGTPYGSHGNRSSVAGRSPYMTPGRSTPSSTATGTLSQQGQFSIESCGSSLPALVMEALTFADKSGEMSVVLSATGWAWLVTSRRLLVWRYHSNQQQHSSTGTPLSRRTATLRPELRELLLPQSDLAHRAQLVVIRQNDAQQMPSCMAVSPEGAVRYWPSIAHESTYTELTAELQGQECESLVYLSNSLGYFLATTTSTTLLLLPSPAPQHGDAGITVRHVKVPAGILGGLSRKVTSLMFGSLPTQAPEARLVRVLCRGAASSVTVLVLSAEYLQCWQLLTGQPDTLLYQAPVLQFCQQALAAKMQGGGLSSQQQNEGLLKSGSVWLLDMQAQQQQPTLVTILLAAVNPARPQDLVLALATVDTASAPEAVSNMTILQHTETLPPPEPNSPQSTTADMNSAEASSPPAAVLSYRLIVCHNLAYVYNKHGVMCVPCNDATLSMTTRIALNGSGGADMILGAGRLHNRPILFSASQGIVALVSNIPGQSVMSELSEEVALSGQSPSQLQLSIAGLESISSGSPSARLQAAFMCHNRQDYAAALNILDELFPVGDYSQLPTACLQLSRTLLDDTPATDPRWAEFGGGSRGGGSLAPSSSAPLSLIITNQIRDKTTAHKYYVTFLQKTSLWSQLDNNNNNSSGGGGEKESCARAVLLEHAQRLAFAATLRSKHQHHQLLIDQAISEVIKGRGETVSGRLTPADLFYCRISSVHQIIWGLMQAIEEVIAADVVPRDAPATLHNTSTLLLALLKAATSVTSATDPPPGNSSNAALSYAAVPGKEHVPWTATEGPKGVRTLLLALHKAIVETGLPRAEDPPTRCRLYATLVELTDQILAGYQPHLASLVHPVAINAPAAASRFESSFSSNASLKYHHRDGGLMMPLPNPSFVPETATPINHERYHFLLKQYQKDRYSLIQPLVEGEQYSQAVSLGEKYCDFRTLVEVCDKTNDTDRLDRYMHQFGSQGFSDFVFRWHLETGKRGRLLSYGNTGEAGGEWADELSNFLKGYSGLEWLHQLSTRDFHSAHKTLKEQGLQESTYLARKKTLLSLSKLCKIASGEKNSCSQEEDEENNMEMDDRHRPLSPPPDPITLEEDLILYQEQLPDVVLASHNLDPDNMRVLTPVEMIQLYTSDENTCASELDFKKALDLLAFVPSMEEAESLKMSIWVKAVLRDSWRDLDTDTPLDSISDTLLFKTIELAFTQGCSLKELLVPADELLACEELRELCRDSGFTFLIQAGYEKIHQLIA